MLLMSIMVERTSLSNVFDTPVPGDLPPALMHRIFVPVVTSTCATNCEDNFVIQFSKE